MTISGNRALLTVFVCLFGAACSDDNKRSDAPPPAATQAPTAAQPHEVPPIDSQAILERIKILASDEFEGRAPGTKGEDLTVKYLVDEVKKLGLQPGNTDGTYVQRVPLVGIKAEQLQPLTVTKGAQKQTFRWGDDVVPWTKRVTDTASITNSDLIFVGYGVDAPEYKWNDFKDVDVKGKTIVVLINDPQVPDATDPGKLDPSLFNGKAMTYYGRWTYKFEEGVRKGAAGVLIVHETAPAGYPFPVVQGNLREKFDIVVPGRNMDRAAIEGWVSLEAARKMFTMAGQNFDSLRARAATREFRPVPLGVTASLTLQNTLRTIDSRNVVAKVQGSDATLEDEYVVYTAHWDHFGIGTKVKGDSIYNGAADNATGTAGLLALGKAFTVSATKPKRSILFLAVTAEEQGLLGSQYYSVTPIYPLAKTVANINIDVLNAWGPTKDITVIGLGASELDDYVRDAARQQGRTIRPDAEPEKGFYYRSDHFNFAKQGVPAFFPESGIDYVGKPAEFGRLKRQEYTANDYHAPQDEIKPGWDLSGAVQDLGLFFTMGQRIANASKIPEWRKGNEFRAIREKQLGQPGSR